MSDQNYVSDKSYEGPSCTHCGAAMVKEFRCLSCGSITGCTEATLEQKGVAEQELRAIAEKCRLKEHGHPGALYVDPRVMAALREAYNLGAQRWIPVEEKLPTTSGYYLIAFEAIRGVPSVKEFYWSPPMHEWSSAVTHWMPLLTPPAAKEGQ